MDLISFDEVSKTYQWLSPVLGVAFFAFVLYLLVVKVPSTTVFTDEDRKKNRQLAVSLMVVVVLFGIVIVCIH